MIRVCLNVHLADMHAFNLFAFFSCIKVILSVYFFLV